MKLVNWRDSSVCNVCMYVCMCIECRMPGVGHEVIIQVHVAVRVPTETLAGANGAGCGRTT